MNPQRMLIAGVGNVFKGDDGFGVEVVRTLRQVSLPDDVSVVDFGIRGIDLAFALNEHEIVVIIDAMQRGREPGTVTVIQPDVRQPPDGVVAIQGHNFDPFSVLQFAARMQDKLPVVYIVGCEPARIPEDDELFEGLSPPVRAAVDEAVKLIESLVRTGSEIQPAIP